MDIYKVINLGHIGNLALMYPSGELVDGFEPHGHIAPAATTPRCIGMDDVGAGCTRGWWSWVGTWRGAYRVLAQPARLRLIDLILDIFGSYGRLTDNLRKYTKI